MRLSSLNDSIAARLALGNGALLLALILVISGIFYFGTVGVLDRSIDGKINSISTRLLEAYGSGPIDALAQEIKRELADGIDSDSEIFLVTSPSGQRIVGNLSTWPPPDAPLGVLLNRDVIRDGRLSSARLIARPLPGGGRLYVGRDLSEQRAIRDLVWHALEAVAAVSLVLAVVGAWLLRRQIERRISGIRRTTHEIEAGNLDRRILISGDDEFARLALDINRMLDRIEQLMNGVRHVSNAIAHDLRTPLSRLRARLDEALRREMTVTALTDAARTAIDGIDDLISVFNKLLQIAEAESGVRTESFARVDLSRVIRDMVELYDPAAEEAGVRLRVVDHTAMWTLGDRDLLATAVASLIDNAIKYAGSGARVELRTQSAAHGVSVVVQDDGPGVPAEELPRLTERFYRMDRARHQPGNGLGLAIVSAIAALHDGKLQLANAEPGLRVAIELPGIKLGETQQADTRAPPLPVTPVSNLSNL
jgi:signal transduction histidine kinase